MAATDCIASRVAAMGRSYNAASAISPNSRKTVVA